MLIFLTSHATPDQISQAALDLDGYVKFVVDLNREVMTIGGTRHMDGEQLLLQDGSHQSDLWGGGVDLETKQIDFESMINIRPTQNNPSREVLDTGLRSQIQEVISQLFIKL
ncbi:MAG: DUF5674 family protein [Patescibacteria group bacterium]